MLKSESVLENVMHKILCDFEKQTDPLISARQQNLEIINKKENLLNSRSGWPQSKTEGKWKVPGPCKRTKKIRKMKVTEIPIVIGTLGTVTKEFVQGLEETCCHSDSYKKQSANASVKKLSNE